MMNRSSNDGGLTNVKEANMQCCEVLSPQEQRLLEEMQGKKNITGGREREYKISETFKGKKPLIDIERAKYFTESMKQTEGQALVLRWAKALKHIAENITVYIDDCQLIVGRAGQQGRYGILYPELDGDFLDQSIEQLPQRVQSPFNISQKDADVVVKEISPYWKGKTFHEKLAEAIPEDTLKLTYDPKDVLRSRYVVNETASFRSSLQWVHDYEKVLKQGFKGIKEGAVRQLEALDPLSPVDNMEKRPYLEAIVTVCDAIVLWAKRHGRLAREMAKTEKDPVRKKEL
jgi:pyruvate-formate lyase